MNLTITQASHEDAELLAEIGAQTFYDSFSAQNDPENMSQYLAEYFSPAKMSQELAEAGTCFLLAQTHGETVGYTKLRLSDTPACVSGDPVIEMERIYVNLDRKGTGIGKALMKAALTRAAADGYKTLWLAVWEHNTHARKFYGKWGFELVGSKPFLLGKDLQNDVIMARKLADFAPPSRRPGPPEGD